MGDTREQRDREVAERILESVKEEGGSERFRLRALGDAFARPGLTSEERDEIAEALDGVKLRSDPKLADAELDGEVVLYLKEKSRRRRLRRRTAAVGAAGIVALVAGVLLVTRDGDDGGDGGNPASEPVQQPPGGGGSSSRTEERPPGHGGDPRPPEREPGDPDAPRVPERSLPPGAAADDCDPNYGGCLPRHPPDIDCTDVPEPVPVRGEDPHGLDTDGNGVACDEGPG